MSLSAGAKLGPYEVLSPIGAGGMGSVWKARDTRLDRTVAIKTIEGKFTERFEREAKTIASLNHPHICTLFDVGENYLVMEHIEGVPIKGPLPVADVIKLGAQIADALDAAHRKGITHRDLKPGNILLTKSGIKVIDFGLAKAGPPVHGQQDVTLTKPLTGEGTILGTVPYMSPEQLQGHEADARSDIWALGCVLYEMLTGKRAFDGASQVSIMAAILEHEPAPLTEPVVPAWLDRIIRRCIRKNPDDRWQNARDVAIELNEPPPTARPVIQKHWQWAAVSVVACGALGTLIFYPRSSNIQQREKQVRFTIDPPERLTQNGFAVSPSGDGIAFIAQGGVWYRTFSALETRLLAETTGARGAPFWSPDSKSIGFRAGDKLKRVDLDSGSVQTLCDFTSGEFGSTGTWSSSGKILFGNQATGLATVLASGGGVSPVSTMVLERPRTPVFLPDGRHFLFRRTGAFREDGIYLASLDGEPGPKNATRIVQSRQGLGYAPDAADPEKGFLMYVQEGGLMAQRMNLGKYDLAGEPIRIAERVLGRTFNAEFSVSRSAVAFLEDRSENKRSLIWYDRSGKALETVGEPGTYNTVALDRTGTRVARSIGGRPSADIWIYDLKRGTDSRLTSDPGTDSMPVWSPGGDRVVYSHSRDDGVSSLYSKPSDGSSEPTPLLQQPGSGFPYDWSRDGRFLLFSGPEASLDLWILPMTGGQSRPVPFVKSRAREQMGQFSPDARWIAYVSDGEVYALAFDSEKMTSSGTRHQVSAGGGFQPRWRADGKELFYLSGRSVMSVSVIPGRELQLSPPKALFEVTFWGGAGAATVHRWDVSADGQRFLINTGADEIEKAPITVILNWQAALRQ